MNRFRFASLTTIAIVFLMTGCGGGSGAGTSVPTGNGGSPFVAPPGATAVFSVDLKTGQVQVVKGQPASRSVFSGDAIQLTSSTVVDVPGDPGYKQINVSVKN